MNPDTRSENQLVVSAKDMPPADIARLLNQIQSNFADLGSRVYDGITQAVENATDLDPETKAEVLARLSPSGLEPQQQYLELAKQGHEGTVALGHDALTAQVVDFPETGDQLDAWMLAEALRQDMPSEEMRAILKGGPTVTSLERKGFEIEGYLSGTSKAYRQALSSESVTRVSDFLRNRPASPGLPEAAQAYMQTVNQTSAVKDLDAYTFAELKTLAAASPEQGQRLDTAVLASAHWNGMTPESATKTIASGPYVQSLIDGKTPLAEIDQYLAHCQTRYREPSVATQMRDFYLPEAEVYRRQEHFLPELEPSTERYVIHQLQTLRDNLNARESDSHPSESKVIAQSAWRIASHAGLLSVEQLAAIDQREPMLFTPDELGRVNGWLNEYFGVVLGEDGPSLEPLAMESGIADELEQDREQPDLPHQTPGVDDMERE